MQKKNVFILAFFIFTVIFVSLSLLFFLLSSRFSEDEEKSISANRSYPTVIIDAGHGGEDGGAVGIDGTCEKDINLRIAQKLFDTLSTSGINCIMTRTEDTLLYGRNQNYEGRKKLLDMQARLAIVQKYDNVIFVSIHQNSFPSAKYSGFQAYFSPNDPRSQTLAKAIEDQIREHLQPSNKRASKPSDGKIYLLDKITCPAVLLECGFISNAEECALLNSEEYQTRLAQTISDSIIAFFNENRQ